jgi:hypothetical protein
MKKYLIFMIICISVLTGCASNDSPETYCSDPANLSEPPPEPTNQYIVYLNAEVEFINALNRIEDEYDIIIMEVYETLSGFHVEMSDDTRELIRCDESVESVHYNEANQLSD